MAAETIAIIGAGVAGLTAARALHAAGLRVEVFDKGRGIGGRLATRQTRDGPAFDHGAQFIAARSPEFGAELAEAAATGHAALWEGAGGRERYVGAPAMTSFAKYLARDTEVQCVVEVSGVRRASAGWVVATARDEMVFDRLVLTVPAPQAARLVGDHPIAARLAGVVMAPCLTLMAEFAPGAPASFDVLQDDNADLAWIARNGSKPGRAHADTWVAHASEAWSEAHLELEKDEIASLMLEHLARAIGRSPDEARLTRGHRWRYGQVTKPLARPFMTDETGTLFLGGDWCLGPDVEDAWHSGTALADALVAAAN